MELKKVGYCYASLNKIKSILKDYNYSNTIIYSFNVVTNKGINFKLVAGRNKIKFKVYLIFILRPPFLYVA